MAPSTRETRDSFRTLARSRNGPGTGKRQDSDASPSRLTCGAYSVSSVHRQHESGVKGGVFTHMRSNPHLQEGLHYGSVPSALRDANRSLLAASIKESITLS